MYVSSLNRDPVPGPPRVWLLMGHKAGDNSQVLALGEALGWPVEVKRLVYKRYELITNLLLGNTLAGIVRDESSPLAPPWPDLVISAGRRNEPICQWIRRQADKRVRLVHMGRPWARLELFDLVVTTPQYRLPRRPNVLHNQTPLHRVTEARLTQARELWFSRLAHLPRPYIAVVVGGNSGPYTFDQKAAERLGRQASAMASAVGGSLLVTTSARTPLRATEALAASISCPVYFYRWTQQPMENPYFGFLALADSIIVTGDSMSMLAEACATRKPVYIFDLGEGPNSMRSSPWSKGESRSGKRWWPSWDRDYLRAFVYRQTMRAGPRRLTRDIRIIHQILIESGRAVWLGEDYPPRHSAPPLEDIPRAVARIRALFDLTVDQDSQWSGDNTDLVFEQSNTAERANQAYP